MYRTLPLMTLIALTACGEAGTEPAADQARLTGHHVSSAAAASGDEEATATAWTYDASGNLTQLEGEAEVQADGSFTLDVPIEGTTNDVIVQVETASGDIQQVLVSSALELGATTEVAPIDVETTVESQVAITTRSNQQWAASTMSNAWLRAMISDDTAEAVEDAPNREAEITALSNATAAAMLAFHDTVVDEGQADASANFDAAISALNDLRVQADAALFASTSGSATQDAHDDFADGFTTLWVDAGFTARETSQAAWAATAASVDLSTEATSSLSVWTEANLAQQVRASIQAHLEALNAEAASYTAVDNASSVLETDLKAAATSSTAADDIMDAWASFDADVQTVIESEMSGLSVGVLTTLTTAIDLSTALLTDGYADAQSASTPAGSADAAVDAMADFRVDVMSSSNLQILTDAAMEDADAEALVALYADLALSVR